MIAFLYLSSWGLGAGDRWCSVSSPRGAIGWSAVCDCGISWSYSLFITRQSIMVFTSLFLFNFKYFNY